MFEALVITFREAMEAFLIVAIIVSYFKRSGRDHLVKSAFWGVGAAVVASVILGFYLQSISSNPMTEGLLAMGAGLLVASMTVHMIKAAKNLKKSITDRLETQAGKSGMAALIGVFLFSMLMVTREGMETALMLNGAMSQNNVSDVMLGALIGALIAAGVGYIWTKKSHLINLPLFLQTTAIFLFLFAVHLFFYGFHEISESGQFPALYAFHDITEFMEEGIVADIMTLSIIAIPLAWLGFAIIKDRMDKKQMA